MGMRDPASFVVFSILLQACLLSQALATCTLRMDFFDASYDPTHLYDPRDDALCVGKPDGFYANVGQCVPEFFACVNGAYFALSCTTSFGPGYVYDPVRCECIPYESSTCKVTVPTIPTSTTTRNPLSCSDREDGSYPIGNSCGSNYFMCFEGTFYPQSCPGAGNVFDPVLSACVAYDRASCKTTIGTEPTSTTSVITTGSSSSTDSTTDSTIPNTSSSTELSSTIESSSSTYTDSTTAGSSTTVSSLSCPTSPSFTCPDPFGNFAIQGGVCCSNYYQCIANNPVVTDCPGTTIFNPDINFCDAEVNVASCTVGSTDSASTLSSTESSTLTDSSTSTDSTSSSSSSSTESTTTLAGSSSTTSGSTSCPTLSPFTCSSAFGNFAIPGGVCCSNYYQCIGSNAVVTDCPTGFFYNPDINFCDYDYNIVTCPSATTTTDSTTPESSTVSSSTTLGPFVCVSVGVFSIPGECSARYYSCAATGNPPVIMECELPTLNFFDCSIKACTDATKAACNSIPGFTCPSGTEISVPQADKKKCVKKLRTQSIETKDASKWIRFVKWLKSF